MKPRELISRLGGPSAVARRLRLHPETVRYWYRQDRVPPWRRDALDALAAELEGDDSRGGAAPADGAGGGSCT